MILPGLKRHLIVDTGKLIREPETGSLFVQALFAPEKSFFASVNTETNMVWFVWNGDDWGDVVTTKPATKEEGKVIAEDGWTYHIGDLRGNFQTVEYYSIYRTMIV